MPILSKRNKANAPLKPKQAMSAAEAVSALKKFKGPKFDQTVDVCIHLGVDTKQADQNLRGSVSLPNGIGKAKRVVAFCTSDVVPKAMAAGAIKAGGEDLVAEVEKGWMDFDVAVASPDMMRVISKLGRVLGPKGLMPSPKAGTVTPNIPDAVKEYSAGKVEYRTDTAGNVHAVIGKMSFPEASLQQNLEAFISTIEKARPQTAKGTYIKKITISGTMTPGIQIKYVPAAAAAEA
ncbi:MAG: 50S ribosomal protein L1 [Phycisphaeraceae bacterium]|nr:50S ribosomal protein L1 [Phycisphaeraceae bacterium]